MTPFEAVWESSHDNQFSWGYPATIWFGTALLAAIQLMSAENQRQTYMVLVVLIFTPFATVWSGLDISEKWRLHAEWAEQNKQLMTDQDWDAWAADGANKSLGPIIFGLGAMFRLIATGFVLSWIGHGFRYQRSKANAAASEACPKPNDRRVDASVDAAEPDG